MQIKYHLNGKKINLTSDNTTIASTNFNVDKNGNMTCSNANIKGNISAGSKITGSTIEGSSIVAGNNFSVDKNGNMTCSNSTITGGEIKIKGGTYTNPKISILDENNKTTSYLAESRLGLMENSNGNFAFMEANKNIAMFEIAYQNGSNIIGTASNTQAYLGLIGQGGGTTITDTGITTPILSQTSKEEMKKNFEPLNNALEIIKKTDIYKYNLKNEEDGFKKHIGFVIGDKYNYAEELTSINNEGADIYSLASVCLQAIKEQQETIETQQQQIEFNKNQIETLKQEVVKLKGGLYE